MPLPELSTAQKVVVGAVLGGLGQSQSESGPTVIILGRTVGCSSETCPLLGQTIKGLPKGEVPALPDESDRPVLMLPSELDEGLL